MAGVMDCGGATDMGDTVAGVVGALCARADADARTQPNAANATEFANFRDMSSSEQRQMTLRSLCNYAA